MTSHVEENQLTNKLQNVILHSFVVVFIGCLSIAVGVSTFYGRKNVELTNFKTQFDGNVQQLQSFVQKSLSAKFAASRLLNEIYTFNSYYGYGINFGQTPPYFNLPGIKNYSLELMNLANLRATEWHPLVDNTTRASWESWTKQILKTQGLSPTVYHILNNTAYTYGICMYTSPTTRQRVSGMIAGGDPRFQHYLFPIWEGGSLVPSSVGAFAIFLDPHSYPGTRFQTIENILAAGYGGQGMFTDVVQLASDGATFRPSTNFYSVVYSMTSTPKILGITNLPFSWDTVLVAALPKNVKRIDCILTTTTTTSTLAVDQGSVIIVGKGDFHESTMTSYGQSIELDVSNDNVISPLAASAYTLTLYPSLAYFNQYNTSQPLYLAIIGGVVTFVLLIAVYFGRVYAQNQKDRIREEAERLKQSQATAKLAEIEAEKEKIAKKREIQLNLELQENIANSAHDMKSPACALSLAVGSLISTFHGKTHIDKDGCKMTMETLIGMMHSLSSLNTIINRSVDAASKITGNTLTPHMDSIDIRTLLGDIMVFMRWQAENSSLAVTLEPYPEHLPTNIWADLKWLREDLLCVAANALKFSQERSKFPVIVRLTIDANDDNTMPPMLCFSFLDSGRNLSEDQHSKLFDYPRMRSSDRMGMGGMGLGLYCLRERVTAMGGRCGSRKRCDSLEGTEVWFSIPLIDADANMKDFKHSHLISPTSQSPSLVQQHLQVINTSAAEVISSIGHEGISDKTSNFVTALGGSRRSSISSRIDDHSSGRKSTDVSPLLTLKQSFDRISEEKGGVTLPILIVDDSISILKMIRRSLLNEIPDLVIKEARDGHEAFDRVQEESNGFHVIITDIQMPNCDGFDFTYRVREFEDRQRLSPVMIIGMSANYQEKIISESVRCGMDGFLHKPFQLQTLMDVINHVQLHRDLTKQLENMQGIGSLSRQSSQEHVWKKATNRISFHVVSTNAPPTANGSDEKPSGFTTAPMTSNVPDPSKQGDNAICKQATEETGEEDLKNVRMLVVDDSLPVLKMMCTTLEEYGAVVTQAKDGQEAIDLCESAVATGGQDFRVILTDIQMPKMDGLCAVRLIRSMEKELGLEPKIIVGISAYYGDRLARKATEAGMNAFLPKPFKYDRFKEVFDDVVQRRNNTVVQVSASSSGIKPAGIRVSPDA